jgi:DNA-binding transcriptional LysR family regulator
VKRSPVKIRSENKSNPYANTCQPPLASLRALEAVGRLLSFRKASEELCISQSAVSYHIKTLEDCIGIKLFNRHARGIAVTISGARVLQLTEYNIVMQAATDSMGLAMGRELLLAEKLHSHLLKNPLGRSVSPESLSYWICRGRGAPSPQAKIFVNWLRTVALAK